MFETRFILALIATASLTACASVDLPSIEFMGQSDFADEIEALDPDYPSLNDTPDIPGDVRTAAEWDQDAREMDTLLSNFDAPEPVNEMTAEEFDAAFAAAQAAGKAYKADDPS